jgi:hypothetical protein
MPKDYSQRQIVTDHIVVIDDLADFFQGERISVCIEKLQELLAKHGDVSLKTGMYQYYDDYEVYFEIKRLETDNEFNKRQAKREKDRLRRKGKKNE